MSFKNVLDKGVIITNFDKSQFLSVMRWEVSKLTTWLHSEAHDGSVLRYLRAELAGFFFSFSLKVIFLLERMTDKLWLFILGRVADICQKGTK